MGTPRDHGNERVQAWIPWHELRLINLVMERFNCSRGAATSLLITLGLGAMHRLGPADLAGDFYALDEECKDHFPMAWARYQAFVAAQQGLVKAAVDKVIDDIPF